MMLAMSVPLRLFARAHQEIICFKHITKQIDMVCRTSPAELHRTRVGPSLKQLKSMLRHLAFCFFWNVVIGASIELKKV